MRAVHIEAGYGFDGNMRFTVTVPRSDQLIEWYMKIKDCSDLDVEIKRHREKRSLNANALFWKCCGSLAEIMKTSNDEMYLALLERYGTFDFYVVQEKAIPQFSKLFRIVKDLGEINVGRGEGRQLQCWVGSSHYNTAQMSRLLDGTISECKEAGGFVPDESDYISAMDLWRQNEKQ